MLDLEKHWENVYQTKEFGETSWYQNTPTESLEVLKNVNFSPKDNLIDIGGGDSLFVDHLLELGYSNVSVLDISATAIAKAKSRLKENTNTVTWIISDVLELNNGKQYSFWHDRAAFHFLTSKEQTNTYAEVASKHISKNGHLYISTFSNSGPTKCSGIEIQQHNEDSIKEVFYNDFEFLSSQKHVHKTPFNTEQNFISFLLKKI